MAYERDVAHIGQESPVHSLLVSPDGLWVATADNDSVLLWTADDGSIVGDWNVPSIADGGLMFTPDSRYLLICGDGGLTSRDLLHSFQIVAEIRLEQEDIIACVWSPDQTLCAVEGWGRRNDLRIDNGSIYIYETAELQRLLYYQLRHPWDLTVVHSWGSSGPAFSHDSRRLVVTHHAAENAGETESIIWVWDVYSSTRPRKLVNYGARVASSSFNPVNSAQVFLALDGGDTTTIQVRDVTTGTVLTKLELGHEFGVFYRDNPEHWEEWYAAAWPKLIYSPTGRHIATGVGSGRIWDVETTAVLNTRETVVPASTATRMAFAPDGTRILSWSPDTATTLWDLHTGRPVFALEAHINLVDDASFSPNGRYIATSYRDGTVRLWNAADGTRLAIFTEHYSSRVTCLTFSPDGSILSSAASNGSVFIRRLREDFGL